MESFWQGRGEERRFHNQQRKEMQRVVNRVKYSRKEKWNEDEKCPLDLAMRGFSCVVILVRAGSVGEWKGFRTGWCELRRHITYPLLYNKLSQNFSGLQQQYACINSHGLWGKVFEQGTAGITSALQCLGTELEVTRWLAPLGAEITWRLVYLHVWQLMLAVGFKVCLLTLHNMMTGFLGQGKSPEGKRENPEIWGA